jgi:hypothetical protein
MDVIYVVLCAKITRFVANRYQAQGSHRALLLAGLPDPVHGAGLVGAGRLPARRMERRRDAHHARVHGKRRLAVLGARL